MVYVPNGFTFEDIDALALGSIIGAQSDQAVLGPACFNISVATGCFKAYYACEESGDPNEPFPILPCSSYCSGLWTTCSEAFKLFWQNIVQNDYASSSLPNCLGNATFSASYGAVPQSPDYIGGRQIPGTLPPIKGLLGVLDYPLNQYNYTFSNGSTVQLTCRVPVVEPEFPLVLPPLQCTSPLFLSPDNSTCVISCPFAVFSSSTQRSIQVAYYTPALVGLVFCLFILVDGVILMLDSTNLRRGCTLRFAPSSSTGQDNSANSNNSPSKTQSKSASKRPLRASTLYGIMGAALGLVYFTIGPLMTLIYGSSVSCTNDFIELTTIVGSIPTEPSACIAQRAAPFVLQAIFNLVFWAMIKVTFFVDDKLNRWSSEKKTLVQRILAAYCAGFPVLALVIAFSLDRISDSPISAFIQLSRESTYCEMRLDSAAEWILIYVPFILTGSGVTVLTLRTFRKLRHLRSTILSFKSQTSMDLSYHLLILRLAILGMLTFFTLIIYIASTAVYLTILNHWVPAQYTFLQCLLERGFCLDCADWQTLAVERSPSPTALGIQLASESMIVVLFGLFFGAQTASRLYVEIQTNTLKSRLARVFHRGPSITKSREETYVVSANQVTVGVGSDLESSSKQLVGAR